MRTVAVQGMVWLGGQRIAVRLLDQVFTIVLVRLLSPREFGLLAMAAIFAGVLSLFAHSGISQAIIQRKEMDDEFLSTAFWANVGVGCVLFMVALGASRFLGAFMREPLAALIVVVLSVRFITDATASTQSAVLQRRMQYRSLSLRPLFGALVSGPIAVVMAYKGMGVWSLVAQQLGASAAGAAALYYAGGFRPKLVFSWRRFKEIWSFGGPLLLARFFEYAVRNTDNLLVGRYLGSVALGFYSLAYIVFLVPVIDIGFPMTAVMFSTLSRMQDDVTRLKQSFLMATRYITMIALPMMVGLAVVAPLMVEVVFGPQWLPSASVMSILALAGFLRLMVSLGPSALQAAGRTDLHMRWALLALVLYLPAFAVGLRWGITGVAFGYLAATAVLLPIQWGFVAKVMGLSVGDLWAAAFPSAAGCAVMAAAVLSARLALEGMAVPKIGAFAVLVTLGVAVYAAVMWIIQRQAVLRLVRIVGEIRTIPTDRRLRNAEEV